MGSVASHRTQLAKQAEYSDTSEEELIEDKEEVLRMTPTLKIDEDDELGDGNVDEERDDILRVETINVTSVMSHGAIMWPRRAHLQLLQETLVQGNAKAKINSEPTIMGKCLNQDHWARR